MSPIQIMANMITRDEYSKYIAVKLKLGLEHKATQTEPYEPDEQEPSHVIPIICTILPEIQTTRRPRTRRGEDSTSTEQTQDESTQCEDEYEERFMASDADSENEDEYEDEDEDESSAAKDIKQKVRDIFNNMKKKRYVNPDDEEYYRALTSTERKRFKVMEDAIYDDMKNETPLRFKILSSNTDDTLKSLCLKKLDQLDAMHSHTDEYYKLYQWVESVARLPIGKYKELPFNKDSTYDEISAFLTGVRTRLDDNVYGHQDTKEHIIRLLAKWISNKDAKGLVIGIEGEMGVGKTSLCLEICKALDLPYGFVSLGGMSNSEYLVGHSYTYEGSKWGKIAEILMHAKYSNPIIYFDELDKVSNSRYGEEIINTLIHITDSTQNFDFRDKYFSEVPLNLSKCIIIFSYNHGDMINPILKDRMITLKAANYSTNDKLIISKKHMIPQLLKEYGFDTPQIVFCDEVIKFIIQQTEEEHGVRKLKRSLEEIISQVNVLNLLKKGITKDDDYVNFPLVITEKIVKKLLPKKHSKETKNPYMYI